ncbi:hypothetical protein IF1G_02620 [Cordyceps javanica]|uniref:Uncharacterized protein n=1 Tax=Cordyceps javanica TaxID=43265 RepID=A0A545VA02_9HYPO|nr:hypothetical protein IF1G_02620 [Cordyceps javanica]
MKGRAAGWLSTLEKSWRGRGASACANPQQNNGETECEDEKMGHAQTQPDQPPRAAPHNILSQTKAAPCFANRLAVTRLAARQAARVLDEPAQAPDSPSPRRPRRPPGQRPWPSAAPTPLDRRRCCPSCADPPAPHPRDRRRPRRAHQKLHSHQGGGGEHGTRTCCCEMLMASRCCCHNRAGRGGGCSPCDGWWWRQQLDRQEEQHHQQGHDDDDEALPGQQDVGAGAEEEGAEDDLEGGVQPGSR